MAFGMGVYMPREDQERVKDVTALGHAALGLANDYFSFDREFSEREQEIRDGSEPGPMVNAVWLCMEWYGLDTSAAKDMVRSETVKYETAYKCAKNDFLHADPAPPERFWRYLDGLSQMIIGNIVWSLACPRYHPHLRYDANAGVENEFLARASSPSFEDVRRVCEERRSSEQSSESESEIAEGSSDNHDGDVFELLGAVKISSDECGHTSPVQARAKPPACTLRPDTEKTPVHLLLNSPDNHFLDQKAVLDPYKWCASQPSKNIRSMLIDALNFWIGVPKPSCDTIKMIVDQLHNASLLLDDIEDSSPLRRGRPSAHTIFGIPESVNSANFAILRCIEDVRKLPNSDICLDIVFAQLKKVFIGQSNDLKWTRLNECPSKQQYIDMVDGKTGGLFHLIVELLFASKPTEPCVPAAQEEICQLVTFLGRMFQIRDDLQNLTSAELADQKGFCEDIDEGKFSYPIIHALSEPNNNTAVLRSVLAKGRKEGKVSVELKKVALEQLEECGSLAETKSVVVSLQTELDDRVTKIECLTGRKNWALRLLLYKLRV